MSAFNTLSIIEEGSERSESVHYSHYEPVVIPETSRYSEHYQGTSQVPRASIFSSETSYGEQLPPGQSAFRSLGLGISLPHYDKSLPSLPKGSITKSASQRSIPKTESVRDSVAKSDSSRHSAAKSDSSGRSLPKPESSRQSVPKPDSSQQSVPKPDSSRHSAPREDSSRQSVPKPDSSRHSAPREDSSRQSVPKPDSSRHSAPKAESSRHSAARSESSRHSAKSTSSRRSRTESVGSAATPVVLALPPSPSATSSLSTESSTSGSTQSSSKSSKTSSVSSASTQSTLRTFDDVVDEVASSLALRTKMRAETITTTSDHIKIGVCTTMSRADDQRFLRILADKLHSAMALHSSYLFALFPSLVGGPHDAPAMLVFCGAPQRLVTKASILAGLRFKSRLAELQDTHGTWIGHLEGHPAGRDNWDPNAQDEGVLWDVVRKAANPVDPAEPPPGSRGVDQVLAEARGRLDRLSPQEAFEEAVRDGMLVDIRPAAQRAEHGSIPGAILIERNVLEWRFDPRSVDGRLPIADRYDLRVIVYCQEGYTSSLAAAALQDIGLWRATDIDGGFARWKNEGFPTNAVVVHAGDVDYEPVSPTTPR